MVSTLSPPEIDKKDMPKAPKKPKGKKAAAMAIDVPQYPLKIKYSKSLINNFFKEVATHRDDIDKVKIKRAKREDGA